MCAFVSDSDSDSDSDSESHPPVRHDTAGTGGVQAHRGYAGAEGLDEQCPTPTPTPTYSDSDSNSDSDSESHPPVRHVTAGAGEVQAHLGIAGAEGPDEQL